MPMNSTVRTARKGSAMTGLVQLLTVFGLLSTAVVAGIFYAFSSFVMPALGRLPTDRGVAAMQAINITAVRPAFMTVLFGAAALAVVLIWCAVRGWGEPYAVWLLVGGAVYLVGTIALTIVFHVPLNNALAVLDPAGGASGPINVAEQWASYQARWNAGNHVRWITPLAASALYTVALLR
jgi:uncharacterized membrane protein